mmetsp:Transcript_23390/g.73229  ORF Transcript_23390/g.73229 Transcript_23390/m.73229 type:complete len:309 (-) Transcript_23390:355-1281(-)
MGTSGARWARSSRWRRCSGTARRRRAWWRSRSTPRSSGRGTRSSRSGARSGKATAGPRLARSPRDSRTGNSPRSSSSRTAAGGSRLTSASRLYSSAEAASARRVWPRGAEQLRHHLADVLDLGPLRVRRLPGGGEEAGELVLAGGGNLRSGRAVDDEATMRRDVERRERLPREREELPGGDGPGVDVRARAVPVAPADLGRHVPQRAGVRGELVDGLREAAAVVVVAHEAGGEAEIEEFQLAVGGDAVVVGLEVAMHDDALLDGARVEVANGSCQLGGEAEAVGPGPSPSDVRLGGRHRPDLVEPHRH